MEKPNGRLGWGILGLFVVSWDTFADDSLTAAFRRGLENPRSRPFVAGALGVTALHLLHALPEQIDPFHQTIELTHALLDRLVEVLPLEIDLDNLTS